MRKIDLHTHSTCSDGLLSPSQVVDRAIINHVDILALTDHDTIDGLNEAGDLCFKNNIKFIPGIELSTDFNNEGIHILGFFRDDSYLSPEFSSSLQELKHNRSQRAKKMISKLKEHFNIDIKYENVKKMADGVVARPHIAREIINCNYAKSMDYVFNTFIGKNCKAYVPTTKLDTLKGVNLLKKYNALEIGRAHV